MIRRAPCERLVRQGIFPSSVQSCDHAREALVINALMTTEQDREAALRWNEANVLRRSKLSTKDKILSYLRKNVGRPVTGEELRYLANDSKEWARRTRELRTEEGWPIATRNSGRPELEVGGLSARGRSSGRGT